MEALTVLFAVALAQGLAQVGGKLLESGVKALLEPAEEQIKERLQRGYRKAKSDKKLLNAIQSALRGVDAPVQDENKLAEWFKRTGLIRLQSEDNHALRRQVARAVIGMTDPQADPPEELLRALGWPRTRKPELTQLLVLVRAGLAGLEEWKDLIAYADAAQGRKTLAGILERLAQLDNLMVHVDGGQALRVVIEQRGLETSRAAEMETRYRAQLVSDLKWHDFRGIMQMKKDIRFPLADIYLELGLLSLEDEEKRQQALEHILTLRDEERMEVEERHLERRVSDALARAQRLVLLGEPGSGKTISLHFIALMLAYGDGAARLSLQQPLIPLMVRLADYARAAEAQPALTLDNYLFSYIEQAYASDVHLGEFLRLALEQGACMVLLDGLDEVADDPHKGQPLRTRVVRGVQQFADRWCNEQRVNRLVVTSRIEGYWAESLRAFEHVQLSPLRPPDEVNDFLLLWYIAHEQALEPGLTIVAAEQRARERVNQLLPSIMEWPSVRRLATNPLLLTILALIHENVGRLPNRRIRLYEIASQTLIESWRQAQTGLPDELLAELGDEMVIGVMAPLAHWLHESKPGGTASFDEWRAKLTEILAEKGYEQGEARDLTERFLHHARHQAGLLAERSLGQYGFFHLTFEEYLAARQIARQRAEERREMLKLHWEDPRWQEVILLAAGQLGIVESRTDDVSDFILDLLQMEPSSLEHSGRPALLAGRALADIALRSVNSTTRRWVMRALKTTMQDLNPDTEVPNEPAVVSIRIRAEAGDVLDELGWLPDDLYTFALLPADPSAGVMHDFYLARYPVTNLQYARFLKAEDFTDPALWRSFPAFDVNSRAMEADWGQAGWEWLQRERERQGREDGKVYPRYWEDPRFGAARGGFPVAGISWYEANAYCQWLRQHWGECEEGQENPGLKPSQLRLPTSAEWILAAGGLKPEGRYPWDSGRAAKQSGDVEQITRRANVRESEIRHTTPVGMYPLGISQPHGLWDLAGNVWEWQAEYSSRGRQYLALRGGSWFDYHEDARVAVSLNPHPDYQWGSSGFRVVALPS
ncbi:MAG TPA: SUMF1/EgtB/PvdO family nonheme iron enzyme [Anaerolineales bacterium]|nr:SUMF1/EgtB/PvdO family nonheme iron enzyme [Anaerolineales bacterium]